MPDKEADISTMSQLSDRELLDAQVQLPQHVVHRSFVSETVAQS